MASRKLARDLFLSKHLLRQQLLAVSPQVSGRLSRQPLWTSNRHLFLREFGVLNDFSNKIKGEVGSNQDIQKSIKEIKEKAEELKGAKEDLKVSHFHWEL
ncbi:hypothetical protein CASFOL_033163 [Castilleja foliolosa]|uniref:Uncharacterized protein n=1 Tax=Castilleja foliolosa TaxID=1961234 RepID=A0ABD3C6E4_9LAMI